MSILKPKKIREMNENDISEKMRELKLELSKEIAASKVGGRVKSPGRIREIRRTIARIKTIENEKKR